jgi:hypothetical protein
MQNMKNRTENTVGNITNKEQAEKKAQRWHNPEMGYHAKAVRKGSGYIVRLVINN